MSPEYIDILTTDEGAERLDSFYTEEGDCRSVSQTEHSFMFPDKFGMWTAVYTSSDGEFFVEEFETKAQAMLYLTCDELSPEEIRKDFAPDKADESNARRTSP